MGMLQGYCRATTIHQILSTLFAGNVERLSTKKARIFDSVLGYDRIKRIFSRSLISKEPVHILIVGPPGHAKTLFLKWILETSVKAHSLPWVTTLANQACVCTDRCIV